MMDHSDFARAAFEPHHRPKLLEALQTDPVLCGLARERVKALELMHQRGRVFDRDAIARMTHETLTRMIAQIDAAKGHDTEVEVE